MLQVAKVSSAKYQGASKQRTLEPVAVAWTSSKTGCGIVGATVKGVVGGGGPLIGAPGSAAVVRVGVLASS